MRVREQPSCRSRQGFGVTYQVAALAAVSRHHDPSRGLGTPFPQGMQGQAAVAERFEVIEPQHRRTTSRDLLSRYEQRAERGFVLVFVDRRVNHSAVSTPQRARRTNQPAPADPNVRPAETSNATLRKEVVALTSCCTALIRDRF
ncbi:hypothetical protein ACFYXQ_37180 [Nocardia jiangxiensis]|uniref:DDE superfamily endonuclease n=1 Tax=Nocardia jiangxiensis TaxID=282685 RepID=A0ABW6SAS0_9NOCA